MAIREYIGIVASKHSKMRDNVKLFFGDGSGGRNGDVGDISLVWNGTKFLVAQAGSNSAIDVGVDGAGLDLKLYGDTASAYALWDQSADALLLGGAARLDLSSATINASNTDGGVIKAGTSSARVTEDTANMNFVSLYWDNGATSGTARGIYNRLYLTGAGIAGESLRTFTTVEDVAAATAHGAHISLSFAASGSITGLGVASRNTLHIPDAAVAANGTYAATQAELWSDGSSSDPSAVTELSFLRCVLGGDGTGIGKADDKAYLFVIDGGAIADGNICETNTATEATHGIRVKVNGTVMYLLASTTP